MTIISISGLAGAGKDTAADVLVSRYNFKKVSFADPLRELCAEVFSLPMSNFLDRDKKDADILHIEMTYNHLDRMIEIVETDWGFSIDDLARTSMEESFGKLFRTPRDILKTVGTLLRNYVREDIFIVYGLASAAKLGGKVVFADVRFENEREALRSAGAILLLIKRPEFPVLDPSENMGDESEYDVIFNNSDKLHVFQSNVDMWFKLREPSLHLFDIRKYMY